MGAKTLMTVEQFLALPADQQDGYELINGERVLREEMIGVPRTTFAHDWVRDTLVGEIRIFAKPRGLGIVSAEPWLQLNSSETFFADGAFWDSAHVAEIDWRKAPIVVAPQLAFEVASPSDTFLELLKKARFYQQNGVHTVWVINDDPLEIHVFEGKDRYVVRAGEMLEARVVLPGFSLAALELIPPE
jgi:Uma2 family endonuclease